MSPTMQSTSQKSKTTAHQAPTNGRRLSPRPSESSRDILSVEEEGEIAEAFDLFDSDGDGCVDFYELRGAFRAVGEELSRKELNVLLRSETPHGTLIATREDYLPEARRRLLRRNPVSVHQTAFRLFTGNDHYPCGVTDMDLRRVANELGVAVSGDEIAAMMDEFDVDRDGMINQEEFIKAMQDPSDGGAEEESTTKGGIIHTRSFSQPTP